MDSIKELRKISKPRIDDHQREIIEDLGITLIEDEDVYWIMEWGPNNKLVLEGKKEEREVIFEPEQALARLLADDIIFMRSDKEKNAFRFFVNCNDIFAWACSDAEPLHYEDIQSLYHMYLKDRTWGSAKWCCIKRNQKPQGPVIDLMHRWQRPQSQQ